MKKLIYTTHDILANIRRENSKENGTKVGTVQSRTVKKVYGTISSLLQFTLYSEQNIEI